MVDQKLIHLKFEYEEARESKMQLLKLQERILNVEQIINNYNSIRMQEFDKKLMLSTKIKSVLNDLRKIHRLLPKEGIPEILKEIKEDVQETRIERKGKKYNPDIESQLKDIQDKLKAMKRG